MGAAEIQHLVSRASTSGLPCETRASSEDAPYAWGLVALNQMNMERIAYL